MMDKLLPNSKFERLKVKHAHDRTPSVLRQNETSIARTGESSSGDFIGQNIGARKIGPITPPPPVEIGTSLDEYFFSLLIVPFSVEKANISIGGKKIAPRRWVFFVDTLFTGATIFECVE